MLLLCCLVARGLLWLPKLQARSRNRQLHALIFFGLSRCTTRQRSPAGRLTSCSAVSVKPDAILAQDALGRLRPAMTYRAHAMQPQAAENAYLERIALPAERLGFPASYIAKIRSFANG
jgi:hypothetical protein